MTDFRPVWNQQSPIALDTAMSRVTAFPKDYLAIDYPNEALPGFFAEHNFWFDNPPCISLDGHVAKLERLHIHSPSEHHVDGAHFPFEIHFVNKFLDESGDSKAVVIGAFFEELSGAPTPAGVLLLDRALRGPALAERTPGLVNPWNFLPTNVDQFFRYEGSLTTPDYDQIVSWVVMPTPVLVDPKDVRALKEHADDSARNLQKVERRFVLRTP